MPSYYRYIVALCFLCLTEILTAQEKDFQTWTAVSVDVKLHKKWQLETGIGSRYFENSRLLKQNYAELGGQYRCNKHWSVAVQYRYVNYCYPEQEVKHRFAFDVKYKNKWKRWIWTWRERLIQKNTNDRAEDKRVLRSRLKLSYDIRKNPLNPFFSLEHFVPISGENQWISSALRCKIGLSYPIVKSWKITAAWMIEKKYQKRNPLFSNVLVISLKGQFGW